MRLKLLSGTTNVVRFPVERRARPSLELLREIAPDVREVLAAAEVFDLNPPAHDLRALVDEATAAYIAIHLSPADTRAEREAMLSALLDPLVSGAIGACREAQDAAVHAAEARQVLLAAQTAGGYWLDALRDRVEARSERAAMLFLAAHTRVEETEGAARAVGLARRGERWTPRDLNAEFEALMAHRRAG